MIDRSHLSYQRLWHLESWPAGPDDIEIIRVHSDEPWGINSCYSLIVDCYSPICTQDSWVASLGRIRIAGMSLPFVVTAATMIQPPVKKGQPFHIQITLKPPIWLWSLGCHRRHWTHATSKKIMQDATKWHSFSKHCRWIGRWDYTWDYWLQYYQTDWDCFQIPSNLFCKNTEKIGRGPLLYILRCLLKVNFKRQFKGRIAFLPLKIPIAKGDNVHDISSVQMNVVRLITKIGGRYPVFSRF